MSEELQNDSFDIEPDTSPSVDATPEVAENTEQVAELAPVEPVEETAEEKQAKVDQAFSKQYGQKKQAERERDALAAEVEALKQSQIQAPVEVGQFPNEYDYDTTTEFENAKAQFVNNLQLKSKQDAHNALQAQTQENTRIHVEQERQTKIQADLVTYSENATKLGVSDEELQKAATAVNGYGLTEDLALAILADSEGPLMTKYLAANPLEVEQLTRLNPIQAGIYLANSVKVKANVLKPKTSSTPNPTTNLQGNSPGAGKDPALDGVIYD
jgi:hypothetical protein